MAEECRYYYYDNGYSCALKREKEGNSSIDSDIVHRYCWGYHYEECPRFKSQSSGGCFLTSACVEAKGLADDCRELTVLRNYRDTYLKNRPNGSDDILEYYRIAPAIIEKIKMLPNAMEIFTKIYDELVTLCVSLIDEERYEDAYYTYKNYIENLKKRY